MDRTIVAQLKPAPEQVAILDQTMQEHTACFNAVARVGDRRWKEHERRILRLRRNLQAKGTRSAKRHLKKLSGKLFRQRRDHVLSKRIVQNATPGSTIVLENLTDIRERATHRKGEGQRRMHSWSFAQFHSFLAYKAQARGIEVVKVDPRHTSQMCSRCKHQARNNRRPQSLFLCRECGYCINADYNASVNIRDKYISTLASLGTSLAGGPSSSGLLLPPLGELQASVLSAGVLD